MKTFYKIMSFVTVFFFTLNCACFAQENTTISSNDTQSLLDFKNEVSSKKSKDSKKEGRKINFNNKVKKISQIFKSYGVSLLKHILSAIIDYTVASIIGNLIEVKIKNKNNPHDTFWLLRDPCCQC